MTNYANENPNPAPRENAPVVRMHPSHPEPDGKGTYVSWSLHQTALDEVAALRDKARAWDAIAGGTLQLCATYVGGTLRYYAMGTACVGERQYGSTFPLHADPLSAVLAAIDGKGET